MRKERRAQPVTITPAHLIANLNDPSCGFAVAGVLISMS